MEHAWEHSAVDEPAGSTAAPPPIPGEGKSIIEHALDAGAEKRVDSGAEPVLCTCICC